MIFITCTITPYTLAFPEVYTEKYYIFDMIMNVIFVIDMFICFISAHYDAEFKIVDDFKVSSFKHRFNILIFQLGNSDLVLLWLVHIGPYICPSL